MGLVRVDIYIIGEDGNKDGNCEEYYIPIQMIPMNREVIYLHDWRDNKLNAVKPFEIVELKKIFDVSDFYIELYVV